jgi:hypothetical protein
MAGDIDVVILGTAAVVGLVFVLVHAFAKGGRTDGR